MEKSKDTKTLNINKIKKIIFKIISKVSQTKTEYTDDIPISEKYRLDSIQFVTLLVEIENIFQIEFDDEHLVKANEFTIDNLANIIIKLLEGERDR